MSDNKGIVPVSHHSLINFSKLSELDLSYEENEILVALKEIISIKNNEISNINTEGGDFKFGVFMAPVPSKIAELIETSKLYSEDSLEYKDLIDELHDFQNPRPGVEIIGLEKKLINANMTDLLNDATYLKTKAIEKISKYQLLSHKVAIHNYIYAKIYEKFNSHILQMIEEGLSHSFVNKYISDLIVTPLSDEICGADPTINPRIIRGMLYILTGNCHLTWK